MTEYASGAKLRRLGRKLRVVGAVAGGITAVGAAVTFFLFDLAPRDGHLTVTLTRATAADGAPELDFHFDNRSAHTVRNLDAGFAFYDADGVRYDHDTFAPAGMTVEADRGKVAFFDDRSAQMDRLAVVWFCGVFDGSYRVDRVRELWLVTAHREPPHHSWGHWEYAKSRHVITRPDCTPPERLSDAQMTRLRESWDRRR